MTMSRLSQLSIAMRRLKSVRRNDDGTTAVEFALVSIPFLMLIFGIISVSLAYFWIFTLENAVWTASRDLRTGVFQNAALGSRYAGKTGDALKSEFKAAVCERTARPSDCLANSRILVQAQTSFGGISQPNCLKADNSLIDDASAMAVFDAGASSSVVMVTACYSWAFGGKLPLIRLGNMADGSFLLQASSAFRTEPY